MFCFFFFFFCNWTYLLETLQIECTGAARHLDCFLGQVADACYFVDLLRTEPPSNGCIADKAASMAFRTQWIHISVLSQANTLIRRLPEIVKSSRDETVKH
uniref:Putative secreted protein salivary gland overexpressed n=1 Tax=Rhipicephalus microplus TaxID=6941 RepID=A0A6M2D9W5_RHIMP